MRARLLSGLALALVPPGCDAAPLTDPKTKGPVREQGNLLLGFKRQPDGALKVAWEIASDLPPTK